MSITIKELAAELSISSGTVSLALNGSPLVAKSTRKRVTELATLRDYVPNNFGRGLQSCKSQLIGYLLGGVSASFFNEILEGAGFEAADHNYGLLTGWANAPDARLENQIQIMLEKNIDGLILSLSPEFFTPYAEKFARRKIPLIFCSTYSDEEFSSVITDNFHGGQMAAEYLLQQGHRRLLCSITDPQRLAGNRAALAAAGAPEPVIFNRLEEVPDLLRTHPEITALLAYSDVQALDLIALLGSAGIRVPEDISIIGFDNIWFAGRPECRLTTIGQQRERLGREAVRGLLAMIAGRESIFRMRLEPELVVRHTVRPLV